MKFYRSWQGVKALTFDLDDTLYENSEVIDRAEHWLANQLKERFVETAHLNTSHYPVYKARVLRSDPQLHHDVTACRLSWLTLLLNECGVPDANQAARELIKEFIAVRSDLTVPQASIKLLDELASRYPLLAITNGNVDAQQIGIDHYFKVVLSPGKGMRRKPWPDLFTQAASHLNVPRHEIAHIGDHPVTDVAGALGSGFRAIWLNLDDRQMRLRGLPDVELATLQELKQLL